MINVKELRIGNYVLLRNKIVIVGGIPNLYKLLIPNELYAVDVEEFEPIPLTDRLLLKCGFEKKQWGSATVYYHTMIELDAHFCLNGVDYNIQVKSLHQLQNLYFYLTGGDLEVNL